MKPGFYDMTHEDYHADPCPTPSLAAHDFDALELSPRHLWIQHPALNPEAEPFEANGDMDLGSALHMLLAGRGDAAVVWIDAEDWRTKDAKARRADARAAGQVPLLIGQRAKCMAIRDAVKKQAEHHPILAGILESPGHCERTMLALHEGVWLRAMADWLPNDPLIPQLDWKFTKRDASPSAYERQVQESYSLRLHHYAQVRRLAAGSQFLAPGYLCVVETDPPYGLMLHAPNEDLQTFAAGRWESGFAYFKELLARSTDPADWPLYPTHVNTVGPAPWQVRAWGETIERHKRGRAELTVRQGHALAAKIGGPVQ